MTQHWAWMFGKVSSAVGELVTGAGDARNRVWAASEYLFQLSPDMVPDSCKDDVTWILQMLTRYPASGYYKSNMEATFHRTRNSTACKIAARVWHLYHVFDSELHDRYSA